MSEVDPQWMFNGLFTIVGLLGGWLLNNIRDAINDLKDQDKILASKVQQIEVLVAGKYATREELHGFAVEIHQKLDKIYQKIESKQDK